MNSKTEAIIASIYILRAFGLLTQTLKRQGFQIVSQDYL
jgi:hypothetical protein